MPTMRKAMYEKIDCANQKVNSTGMSREKLLLGSTKDAQQSATNALKTVLASVLAKTSFEALGSNSVVHRSRRISQDSSEKS